jgi:hypothetical protein
MNEYELKDIHPEDIEELLVKVETSFGIRFSGKELVHCNTFGKLCDYISSKVNLQDSVDCTGQQAFYKLREAIVSTLQADNQSISANMLLADILPRKSRRSNVKSLEAHLGFKLNVLRPRRWVQSTLVILLLTSLGGLFFNWQVALIGLAFYASGIWLANKFGNELDLQTIGQVVEKIKRENYLKSRRNPKTFNSKEVEKILTDWFSEALELEKGKLSRETEIW